MKRKIQQFYLATLALLFAFTVLNAQKDLKDGFVILNSGDTLHGQINDRNWEANPLKIQFYSENKSTSYSPADISYFSIPGECTYVTKVVTKEMRPIDLNELLLEGDSDTTITSIVFLKVLVIGQNVNLYELVDFKPHYYVQRAGTDSIEELLFKKYIAAENSSLTESHLYRNQLTNIAISISAPENVFGKIEKSRYKEQDMRVIARILNREDENIVKTSESKNFNLSKQILVGGGLQFYTFSFVGNYSKYTNLIFKNGSGPIASIALDLFTGKLNQKFAIRFELAYSQIKLDGSYVKNDFNNIPEQCNYKLTQNNITPGFSILYHFINGKKVRVYAGVGAGYVFSSYPTNVFTRKNIETGILISDKDIMPAKNWMSGNALLGTRINNKINFAISTQLFGVFYNYVTLDGKLFPIGFTASYVFTTGRKRA